MPGLRQPRNSREGISIAASVTLTNFDCGKTFFVTAAATVTLPAPSTCPIGAEILVINTADTDLTVGLNELIITKNNAAADSVALSTSSEKIGGAFWCHNTGAAWVVLPLTEETQTVTVTTD